MGHRIGIDLGTTNSVVAYTADGRQKVVRLEDNAYIDAVFPSCVGVMPDGEFVTGERARRAGEHLREFKRAIGKNTMHALGGRALTAIELSTLLLRTLREGFEKKIGPIDGAVITVPANYTDEQRREVREAGALAGLDVLRVINEPSAAAIAYSLSDRPPEGKAVVIDWGGGTLDVSIIDLEADILDILANDGDPECGGKDVDLGIVRRLVEKYPAELAPLVLKKEALSELELEAERLKILLGRNDSVADEITIRSAGKKIKVELTRGEFEAIAEPYVDRVMAAVKRALAKSPTGALVPKDIGDVILVGGSCRMELMRRAVFTCFGKDGRADLNPMEVVALGAAYQAEHAEDAGQVIVLHSLVHSLGVRCRGTDSRGVDRDDMFAAILPATTKVPAREKRSFMTMSDNQDMIVVEVYEGDGETIAGMRLWDKRAFGGLPRGKAGSFSIEVTFDYDIEQILTVSIEIPGHEFRHQWTPTHQKRLADGREASRRTIDAVLDDAMGTFRRYAARVEKALPAEGAPLTRMHLAALMARIDAKDVEGARRAQADLMNALSFDGVNLN